MNLQVSEPSSRQNHIFLLSSSVPMVTTVQIEKIKPYANL